MARIIVVDDEASILAVFGALLKAQGHEVDAASDGPTALGLLDQNDYNVMVSDMRMSPMNGMELLKLAHEKKPTMAVIMLTAYSSVETAIESLKHGAFDYCTKPFKVDEFLEVLGRALTYNEALLKQGGGGSATEEPIIRYHFEGIVAESDSMKATCEQIRKMGPAEGTVLIYGENGVGKELIARTIHACSRRKDHAVAVLNCATLPEPLLEAAIFGQTSSAHAGAADQSGLFEQANGGSVFLEEIDTMSLALQERLLAVIKEKTVTRVGGKKEIPVDARVLAAANAPLDQAVAAGTFVRELHVRLSALSIEIKPLRERKEDILPFARLLLKEKAGEGKSLSMDAEVEAIFKAYQWPGNVGELKNVLSAAADQASGESITKDLLPEKIAATPVAPVASAADDLEKTRGQSLRAFLKAKAGVTIRKP